MVGVNKENLISIFCQSPPSDSYNIQAKAHGWSKGIYLERK